MTMCTEMIFRTCRPSSERSTMWFQRSKEQNQTNHALTTAGPIFLLLLILPVMIITLLPSAIIPVIVLPSVILVIIRLINLVLISL
jgi:hypothetical protein